MTLTVLFYFALVWCLVSWFYSRNPFPDQWSFYEAQSGSVWRHSTKSLHTWVRCPFWSTYSILSTIFVLTFCMLKSSEIIFQAVYFFTSSWFTIIQTVHRRSPLIINLIPFRLSSVLLKVCRSESYLSPLHAPLWTNIQKNLFMTQSFLHSLAEVFQVLVMKFYPTRGKSFRCIRYSVFIACSFVLSTEQPEKENM